MQLKEIELTASRNNPMPKYLTVPEIWLYMSLRTLYSQWRRSKITKENAVIEKQRIIGKYAEYNKDYENWRSVYKAYQNNIKKAGSILNDIEKSDDIDDIAIQACKVIGIMIGDESFAARQKKKLKGENL